MMFTITMVTPFSVTMFFTITVVSRKSSPSLRSHHRLPVIVTITMVSSWSHSLMSSWSHWSSKSWYLSLTLLFYSPWSHFGSSLSSHPPLWFHQDLIVVLSSLSSCSSPSPWSSLSPWSSPSVWSHHCLMASLSWLGVSVLEEAGVVYLLPGSFITRWRLTVTDGRSRTGTTPAPDHPAGKLTDSWSAVSRARETAAINNCRHTTGVALGWRGARGWRGRWLRRTKEDITLRAGSLLNHRIEKGNE